MAIEFVPKPKVEEKPSWWVGFFFYLAIIFLVGTLIGYSLIAYLSKSSSEALKNLEDKISSRMTSEEKRKESDVLSWHRKIEDYKLIFNHHQVSSKNFDLLEKLTHPQVRFTSFDLDSASQNLKLEGVAQNFQALAEQILIFRNDNLIDKADLSAVSLAKEGNIEFELNLLVKPEVFKP